MIFAYMRTQMKPIKNIEDIRRHFPALKQKIGTKPLVYLDNGATTQKPESVIELVNSMNSGINGNVHRAVHELSARSTQLYEGARDAIKEFVNAREREEIIFTSGTTAAINLVAESFVAKFIGKDDLVLITEAEHHSNIVPWQMACERSGAKLTILPIDENGCWRMELLDGLLDERVKIVSVAHISNVLGVLNPIKELITKAHSKGIPVLIDGAQGIVHSVVDVQALDCDFYTFSGHKLYGPTGIGVLYGKREWLDKMPPWMGGGDMIGSVTLEKSTYAELPLKFEAGTPNYIGASGLGEAVRFISSIDKSIIDKNEIDIIGYLNKKLPEIEGMKIYGASKRKIALFSMSCEGVHPSDIASILDKMGVAVRSGQLCAEPLMAKYGVSTMVRASFAMYNTIDEAVFFVDSLKRAIEMLR